MDHHFTIVGQGLAGTLLALALEERGVPFAIWDAGGPSASEVAAGLIVPVFGERWQKLPELERLLPFALRRYRELSERFGLPLLHPVRRLRLFRSERERERFSKRLSDPAFRPYFGEVVPPGGAGLGLRDGLGGVWLRECYRLETRTLLQEARRRWLREGRLRPEPFPPAAEVRGTVVSCQGWQILENRLFSRIPWRPAFGEILTLRAEGLPDFLVQRGKWLLPVGEGRYRLGATYRHRFSRVAPTEEGRRELLEALSELFREPVAVEVEGIAAGVRIQPQDGRPVLGRHPEAPKWAVLSGFGSHGALKIPFYTDLLARHLIEGQPLPKEVDVARFWR